MHTINIPAKTFVRKYIQARYRQTIWNLNKSDRIGRLFYSMLDRAPIRYEKIKFQMGDSLTVRICEDYSRNKGLYITNESIAEFNDQIKLELIEEIVLYIHKLKTGVGIKKYKELYIKQKSAASTKIRVIRDPDIWQYFEQREVIYDILKKYDITEDDFPFDTIVKSCQRLKIPLLSA